MLEPAKVAEALVETATLFLDTNEAFEQSEMVAEELQDGLPPNADALSQRFAIVDVDGVKYAVVAYRVAG